MKVKSIETSNFTNADLAVTFSSMCESLNILMLLKGTPSKDGSWPETVENVQIFSTHRFRKVVLSMFRQQKHINNFLFQNLSSSGCSHDGSLFSNEEEKKVGS